MFIVPRPARTVLSIPYVVEKGDTVESITRVFGRPSWSYGDLVSANLDRMLTYDYCAPNMCAKLDGLREGDRLRIPSAWRPCAACQKPSSIAEGRLGDPRAFFHDVRIPGALSRSAVVRGDLGAIEKEPAVFNILQNATIEQNNLDPIQLDIADLVEPSLQAAASAGLFPSADAARPAVLNFVHEFWRKRYTNQSPKSVPTLPRQDFDAIVQSALAWYSQYGQFVPPARAAAIPFGSISFARPEILSAIAPALAMADWGAIQGWLKDLSASEVASHAQEVDFPPWADKPDQVSAAWVESIPWATTPWDRIPFIAIPTDSINPAPIVAAMKAAGETAPAQRTAATEALLTEIARIYGKTYVRPAPPTLVTAPPVSSRRPTPAQGSTVRHPAAGPGSLFPAMVVAGRQPVAGTPVRGTPARGTPARGTPARRVTADDPTTAQGSSGRDLPSSAPTSGASTATSTATSTSAMTQDAVVTRKPQPGDRPPAPVKGAPSTIDRPAGAQSSTPTLTYGLIALAVALPFVVYGGIVLGRKSQKKKDEGTTDDETSSGESR